MLEAILLYCAAVYFLFHVVSRADILNVPRAWVTRTCPAWLTYILNCAFCYTFWVTLAGSILGIVPVDGIVLFVAPVVNLVLDLVVRALIRANEPPLIAVSNTSNTVTMTAGSAFNAGQLVTVRDGLFQPYAFFDEHLNRPDLVGRLAKHRGDGLTGTIQQVYRCGDDCAGSFRKVCYRISVPGGSTKVIADECDLLDTPFNPLDHEQTR